MINVNNGWQSFLDEQQDMDYYKALRAFLAAEYRSKTIYPAMDKIFSAYIATPPDKIKAVILGQDPYHQPKQAHGMAFSVMDGVAVPPSLQNIHKEIADEYGSQPSTKGYLVPWADQGVFMLNSSLTVEASRPNSHAGKGWETFTDNTIEYINSIDRPIVYLLWGRNAKEKSRLITNAKHLVLQAAHPSPFSAHSGFFGCGHFKRTNEFLESHGIQPIEWRL